MITAGIDSGKKSAKSVIVRDHKVIGKTIMPTGFDANVTINQVYDEALKAIGTKRSDIQKVIVTGIGKKYCDFAQAQISEVQSIAKGIMFLAPAIRTIIDVGAEESKAIKIGPNGTIIDFAINDKCAAGTGSFVEATARALEMRIEDMAELYDQSTKLININAQCAIFAESEVVSLIHALTEKADIVRAVLDAIGNRTVSMTRRVGIENEIAAIGGMALNGGFVKAIEQELKAKIVVPPDPQYVSALGAAIVAAEQIMEEYNHAS
jgi:predicted CoA-substrate-specific enzyme activase